MQNYSSSRRFSIPRVNLFCLNEYEKKRKEKKLEDLSYFTSPPPPPPPPSIDEKNIIES